MGWYSSSLRRIGKCLFSKAEQWNNILPICCRSQNFGLYSYTTTQKGNWYEGIDQGTDAVIEATQGKIQTKEKRRKHFHRDGEYSWL